MLQDWERTFHKLNRAPNVAAVLDKIQPGGNLWAWYQSQCTHQDSRGSIHAHDIIDNWTWERFKQVLRSSHLHKEPDREALRKDFDELKCPPYPSSADLESFISAFENKAQKLRVHNMIEDYPDSRLANKFFQGWSAHVQRMCEIVPGANTAADPHDPTRRTNYAATKHDLLVLLKSPYAKHKIQLLHDTHNKKNPIAGGAATRATVQNVPNTTHHIGSIGQYRLTISPRSTGQNDSTDHKTRMERITKRLQEMQKADKQLVFKQYTNRQRKQVFLIVHNLESYLQRVSTDHILISIGMKASSIYEITGRPVPSTTTQTVSAASNINLPEQQDLTNAVEREDSDMNTAVNMFSPAPSASLPEPERGHQKLNLRPPSSKGLFNSSLHTSVCIIAPPSVSFSEEIFFEEAVDDRVDDIHPDHPLGRMEITDTYIHSMHIIPHMKINGDVQFRALNIASSIPNKTEDHAYSSCATFRKSPYPPSRCMKKRVPKRPPCQVSVMSMSELEAIIADFNKLPPTAYQVSQPTPPKLLKQQCFPRHSVVCNVSACVYLLSWATSICLHANALPMFSAILAAIVLLPITMLHLHNTMGTIGRRITTSWANNVTPILAMFGLGLLPRTAGEAKLFLTSQNNLHLSGPQVSTCLIHSNVTVNASHNLSDAPAFSIYLWDAILLVTFVLLSHVLGMIFLQIPCLFSRKQSQ